MPRFALTIALALMLGAVAARAESSVWSGGDNPWLAKELTKEDLLPSVTAGAQFLVRHQLADGRFVYVVDPKGSHSGKGKADGYSLIRHLGGVYALLRTHELAPDPALLEAARRGIDFVRTFRAKHDGHEVIRGLKGKVAIGENGFLLIDTVLHDKLTGGKTYAALSRELAAFLKKALVYEGRYATAGQWAEHQALIGLAHYYLHVEKDPEIVAVAKRFLHAMMAAGKSSHWSVQAQYWYGLMTGFKDEASNAYALATARKLLDGVGQQTPDTRPRLVGAKNGKLRSCGATARNEGLVAAHLIANATGKRDEASFFLARVKEHIAFALQFQYGQTGGFYEKSRSMTRVGRLFGMEGGVFDSPDEGHVRVDFVSHHVRAIASYVSSPQAPVAVGLGWQELEAH